MHQFQNKFTEAVRNKWIINKRNYNNQTDVEFNKNKRVIYLNKSYDESKTNYWAKRVVNYNFHSKMRNIKTSWDKTMQKSRFAKFMKLNDSTDYSERINQNSSGSLKNKRTNGSSNILRQNKRNLLCKNSKNSILWRCEIWSSLY